VPSLHSPAPHFTTRRSARLFAGALALALLAGGCLPDPGDGSADESPDYLAYVAVQDEAERDEALALLESADASTFRRAFETLGQTSFRRYTRTEQLAPDETLIAYQTYTVRRLGSAAADGEGSARYVRLDSTKAGTFDFGFFRHFVSASVEDPDTDDLTPLVLPEDPAYLEPRQRESYFFWMGPDTLLGDVQARQIRVRARPDDADGQNIRRARIYVHPQTNRVLAASLERVDLAMLFREESAFFVHVRETPGGGAVPVNTRFRSLVRTPFRPPQIISTRSSYSDFGPIVAGSTDAAS
jgi:hypothetical protein